MKIKYDFTIDGKTFHEGVLVVNPVVELSDEEIEELYQIKQDLSDHLSSVFVGKVYPRGSFEEIQKRLLYEIEYFEMTSIGTYEHWLRNSDHLVFSREI